MMSHPSFRLFIVLFSSLLRCSWCGAQTPNPSPPAANAASPIMSSVSGGYKVALSNFEWDNGRLAGTDLLFDVAVERADGAAVTFADGHDALYIVGWSDSGMHRTPPHSADPNYNDSTHVWRGRITGIDPRDKVVKLKFYIRDPGQSDNAMPDLNSDFRLEKVPLPAKPDTLEPVDLSFTSNWGTLITLTGITYVSKGQYGQPQLRYDFTVKNPKYADDIVGINFVNAFDNGVQVQGLNQWNNGMPSPQTTTSVLTSAPALGSPSSADLEFTAQERSISKMLSTVWSPVDLSLSIDPSWTYSDSYHAADQGDAAIGAAKYRIVHVADPPNRDRFLVYIQSSDPNKQYIVAKAAWTVPTVPPATPVQSLDLFDNIYWNIDQTVIAPGETGAFVRNNSGPRYFPLLLTVTPMTIEEQTLAFSNLPLPAPGQSVVLDRAPDKPTSVPIRIRSITSTVPVDRPYAYHGNSDNGPAWSLQVNFEYSLQDNSTLSLGLLKAAAPDGAELLADAPPINLGFENVNTASPDDETFAIHLAAPPKNVTAADLVLDLTKNTPMTPIELSVSSDDKITQAP